MELQREKVVKILRTALLVAAWFCLVSRAKYYTYNICANVTGLHLSLRVFICRACDWASRSQRLLTNVNVSVRQPTNCHMPSRLASPEPSSVLHCLLSPTGAHILVFNYCIAAEAKRIQKPLAAPYTMYSEYSGLNGCGANLLLQVSEPRRFVLQFPTHNLCSHLRHQTRLLAVVGLRHFWVLRDHCNVGHVSR